MATTPNLITRAARKQALEERGLIRSQMRLGAGLIALGALSMALLRLVSAQQADAMPPIQDQIAKASSSNATAIRWFTGSSTASS